MSTDHRAIGPRRPPRRTTYEAARRPHPPRPGRPLGVLVVAAVAGAIVGGGAVRALAWPDQTRSSTLATAESTVAIGEPSTTTAGTRTTPSHERSTTVPSTTAPPPDRPDSHDWGAVAAALAPHVRLPSDCPLPLDEPESLPNADRSYRGGVHEGIDFICGERGRDAVAAMAGRVLIADDSFEDPAPADRQAVLDIAKRLGYTPPWTLAMLFGRFVVLDHGEVPGAGHVVTIYAHLDTVDADLRIGQQVPADTRLGEIGNRGTETGATGASRARSIHLHWEIHVDGDFLGDGETSAGTRAVYAVMFGRRG